MFGGVGKGVEVDVIVGVTGLVEVEVGIPSVAVTKGEGVAVGGSGF